MSDAAAHARAAVLLDVMERGLDAEVADAPSEARDWVDAYVLLFCGRFAEALEAVASVDDGSEPARAARAQIEALCTGTVTVSLQASGDAATLAGAMATFQLSEAAHIVGAIDECVRMLRSALTGRVPVRARVWLRLALVRALLFRGELGAAADELALAARDARAPQARRSVRCLRALVEGFAGRSEAVVAEAVALRREILPARSRPGWDYVLVGRPEATIARDFAELRGDLEQALARVHEARAAGAHPGFADRGGDLRAADGNVDRMDGLVAGG